MWIHISVILLTIDNISQHPPLCSVSCCIVQCCYIKVPDVEADGHSRPLLLTVERSSWITIFMIRVIYWLHRSIFYQVFKICLFLSSFSIRVTKDKNFIHLSNAHTALFTLRNKRNNQKVSNPIKIRRNYSIFVLHFYLYLKHRVHAAILNKSTLLHVHVHVHKKFILNWRQKEEKTDKRTFLNWRATKKKIIFWSGVKMHGLLIYWQHLFIHKVSSESLREFS